MHHSVICIPAMLPTDDLLCKSFHVIFRDVTTQNISCRLIAEVLFVLIANKSPIYKPAKNNIHIFELFRPFAIFYYH